jgi:[ribosomal protein S5]-alanine N-acetyltransferase
MIVVLLCFPMMELEIVPCAVGHLEKLIEGADAFEKTYGLQAIPQGGGFANDGYMPFQGALDALLNQMQSSQLRQPWLPYLLVFRPDRAVVGLGGFKSVPDARREIEIGYSVAPNYQGRGFATFAACQLIEIAFGSKLVARVCAHTLAEHNASARVLVKSGMTKASAQIDPNHGNLWRWEICAR